MPTYGLTSLEIQQLIQRALLPDKCECTVENGVLTLRLIDPNQPEDVFTAGANIDTLRSRRAIAELVGEARYLLATAQRTRATQSMRGSGAYRAQPLAVARRQQ